MFTRARTRTVGIGPFKVGGGNLVRVQSMCNTDTRDTEATVAQIRRLENAGCEIIRVAVPDMAAAQALGVIKKRISIPLVADIHFDWRLALEAVRQGVAKIRINPGNIGDRGRVREVALACSGSGVPIRIGVNAGSLKALRMVEGKPAWSPEKWAEIMVEEALSEAAELEACGFHDILVSLKADDVERTLMACRLFARKSDIPQHIGVTEAGSFLPGVVKSSMALGSLLGEGLGDTVRVSLTEDPVLQVRTAYEILKGLGLRCYGPDIISCPTCGRCQVDVHGTVSELESRIYGDPALRHKAEGLKIAVMGCVVNGPGEARSADFGIAGGKNVGVWIENGRPGRQIPCGRWIAELIEKIQSL
ncbi:MAG: flavodoxin-dependent (E)-4-hydroxy-3-methylbut-2-enyl-diphosphate synthase [Elusimicrobiaceae bacterium]|nr:flavodoxin-dependent (E)-4-hydroxy-3-methylbut-2-enyl-diphosphate synthase [Elusimicrobiaceae bacterium]